MIGHLIYIDPGSGSYLVQMIIAAILGSLFYIKTIWRRIKFFFTGKKDIPEQETTDE